MAQAPLVFSGFPVGYCYPSNPTQLVMDAISLMYANVPDNITGVAYGPTDPGSTTKLWYNSTVHRLYEWSAEIGRRIALYWCEGDPDIKMITEKTETEIANWDNPGGAASVPGAEQWTGPFWVIDHEYDGRFVVGPGALPSAAIIAPLAEGGADKVTIGVASLPSHRHEITLGPESGDSSYLPDVTSENGTFKVNGAEQIRFYDLPSIEIGRTRLTGGQDIGVAATIQPVDIMPPYRAAWIVKRTARIYYTL